MQVGEALHQLDPHDVFRHLVAELPFEAQPQRRAVGNGQRLVAHVIGEDRLRMRSIDQVDALIVASALGIDAGRAIVQGIGAMEHDKAGLWPDARTRQYLRERHTGPFADTAPALDTIMPGDLGARGLGAQLLERQRQFVRDEAVNLQAPVGKMFVGEIEVVLVLGVVEPLARNAGEMSASLYSGASRLGPMRRRCTL
jgi:hypothetical protein